MRLHGSSRTLMGLYVIAVLASSPSLQAQNADQTDLLAYRLTFEGLEKYVQVFLNMHDSMRRGQLGPLPSGPPGLGQSPPTSLDVKASSLLNSGQAMVNAITISGLPPKEFVIIQTLLNARNAFPPYLSSYNIEFLEANKSTIDSYHQRIDASMGNILREIGALSQALPGTPSGTSPISALGESTGEGDWRRDLLIFFIGVGRDLTGTLASWEVRLSNRSRGYSYRNIQYVTSYYDSWGFSQNNLVSQRRGTFPGEVAPDTQYTFSIEDGLYPQSTLHYTIELKSAEAYEVANQ